MLIVQGARGDTWIAQNRPRTGRAPQRPSAHAFSSSLGCSNIMLDDTAPAALEQYLLLLLSDRYAKLTVFVHEPYFSLI